MGVRHGEFDACCIAEIRSDVTATRKGVCAAIGRRDFKSTLEQTQRRLGQSRTVKSGANHQQSDLIFGLERRQGRDVGRESRNNQQMYWHETRGGST